MIKHKQITSLTDILIHYLSNNGLLTPLIQYRIINNWSKIVGQQVSQNTLDLKIRNQTLYVRLKSSIIKTEIQMNKSEIISKLNQSVNSNIIVDLIAL